MYLLLILNCKFFTIVFSVVEYQGSSNTETIADEPFNSHNFASSGGTMVTIRCIYRNITICLFSCLG